MSRNLLKRIAVAAVAIPLILWICYTGGAWLYGMVALFAAIASYEFVSNEGYRPRDFFFWFTLSCILICFILARIVIPFDDLQHSDEVFDLSMVGLLAMGGVIILPFFMITGMIFALGKRTPAELFTSHVRLVWGVVYIGLLYPLVYALGNDNAVRRVVDPASNGDMLLLLFGILWVGDTAAMGIGKWMGKHKLAPAVSPNKTVEGFIGGFVGAIVIALIVYFWKLQHLPVYHVLVLAVGCSIFGQLGDLVESMWKRSVGIKDSSAIIPGHGGLLDRFDSLLFAAPFMYFYLLLVMA